MITSIQNYNLKSVNFTGKTSKNAPKTKDSYEDYNDINRGHLYSSKSLIGKSIIAYYGLSSKLNPEVSRASAPIYKAAEYKKQILPKMLGNVQEDVDTFLSAANKYSHFKRTLENCNPVYAFEDIPEWISADKFFGFEGSRVYYKKQSAHSRYSTTDETVNVPSRLMLGVKSDSKGEARSAKYIYDFDDGVVYHNARITDNQIFASKITIVEPKEAYEPVFKFAKVLDRAVVLSNANIDKTGTIQADSMSLIKTKRNDDIEEVKTYHNPTIHQDVFSAGLYEAYTRPADFTISADATFGAKYNRSFERTGVFELNPVETIFGNDFTSESDAMLTPVANGLFKAYSYPKYSDGEYQFVAKRVLDFRK